MKKAPARLARILVVAVLTLAVGWTACCGRTARKPAWPAPESRSGETVLSSPGPAAEPSPPLSPGVRGATDEKAPPRAERGGQPGEALPEEAAARLFGPGEGAENVREGEPARSEMGEREGAGDKPAQGKPAEAAAAERERAAPPAFSPGGAQVRVGGAGAKEPSAPAASARNSGRVQSRANDERGEQKPPIVFPAAWASGEENLRFRIRFLGVTVGYATFRFRGTVDLEGRPALLLSVRARTTGSLSMIYPVRQEIDYYLDPGTLLPLRQEYLTGRHGKDDQVIFDQERGTIVYRDRRTKEVGRTVKVVPGVFDPVTAAYSFRARKPGAPERPRMLYAGRKLWSVTARRLGIETVETPGGRYQAVLVEPVLAREGRVEDRWFMRLWMTDDDRRVPVRVFAKFHKIVDWTLLGELEPGEGEG